MSYIYTYRTQFPDRFRKKCRPSHQSMQDKEVGKVSSPPIERAANFPHIKETRTRTRTGRRGRTLFLLPSLSPLCGWTILARQKRREGAKWHCDTTPNQRRRTKDRVRQKREDGHEPIPNEILLLLLLLLLCSLVSPYNRRQRVSYPSYFLSTSPIPPSYFFTRMVYTYVERRRRRNWRENFHLSSFSFFEGGGGSSFPQIVFLASSSPST